MEQLKALFAAFEDDPMLPVVKITALYGLRRSELLGLQWDSIDFTARTMTIRHTVAKVQTVVAKDKAKNASSHRIFPLTDETLDIFKAIKKEEDKTVPLSEKLMAKTPIYSNGPTADPIRRTTSPTSSASC